MSLDTEVRDAKMVEAVQRDLHLTRAQAITRLGRAAGRYLAGSWLKSDGSVLMVAFTDRRAGPAVRAAGATPVLVAYEESGALHLPR